MAEPAASAPAPARPAGPSLWRRAGRIAVALVAVGMAVLAAGNIYVLASTASRIYPRVEAVPARRAAIVLGALVKQGQPLDELAQRLAAARDLYRSGKVERIVISGAARGDYSEPDAMLRWLLAQGISRDVISIDGMGVRTMATMARAAAIFDVRGAVVCTQAYHLPRALLLAKKAGIDAVGLAADGSPYARQNLREIVARTAVLFETALFGLRAAGLS